MIYVLDHYYSIDHQESCLIVESNYELDEVIEIYSAIEFLLEEEIDECACLDDVILLQILESFYGFINRKPDVPKDVLNGFNLPIGSIYKKIGLYDDNGDQESYIIDLYEARESCCGKKYKKIMKKWLPIGARRDDMMAILRMNEVVE